jgi:hypothetical protein
LPGFVGPGCGKTALLALSKIKSESITTGAGRRRSARQLRRFSPIFGVRDLRAALAHYATLGFETFAYDDGDVYGFARRDGIELHLAADPEHDRPGSGAAYLYVRDADELYKQWSRPGVAGLPGTSRRGPRMHSPDVPALR